MKNHRKKSKKENLPCRLSFLILSGKGTCNVTRIFILLQQYELGPPESVTNHFRCIFIAFDHLKPLQVHQCTAY